MKLFIPGLFIVIWLLAGLYFGTGGITRLDNIEKKEKAEHNGDTVKAIYKHRIFQNMAKAQAYIDEKQTEYIYPWITPIPAFLAYMITSCSFGLLGSLIFLLTEIAFNDKKLEDIKYLSIPLLGMLTGIVVLGLSLLIPNILIAGNKDIKPEGLVFLCLFCGLYSNKFYIRLSNIIEKIQLDK